MFQLVRALRPITSLELGTAVGLSGAYQGAALDLNGGGRLLTLEGSAGVASLAGRNFQQLNLTRVEVRDGLFRDTLKPALENLRLVDFSFIDGHHDEKATVTYFEQILPYVPNDRVIVFDDINWSDGMKNAWEALQQHDRVSAAVDVRKLGICIIGEDRQPTRVYRLPHLERLSAAA
jgi:predicted O-methyltransferase YrrM